ncbi:MAG: alpha/beta hydrolase [Bacillota bacterium]|nr:alpha/beta hydrolase [Bacillota bacterium]
MRIKIDDLNVNYTVSGPEDQESPATVLLLHGWGVDSSAMEPLRSHLAQSCCAVSLDLPGFGGTAAPPEAWSVFEYADFVERFIQKLKLENVILLGHSFGGRLSIILGSRGVGEKIILTDAAGILPKRSCKYYLRVYSYKAVKWLFSLKPLLPYKERALKHWLRSNPSSDYAQAQGVMRQIFVKVVNQDLQPLLQEIKASTLLLWGEKDTATPLSDGKLMEKLIPDAGLVVFEGAGHYPFLEQPGRFYSVVDYFITH